MKASTYLLLVILLIILPWDNDQYRSDQNILDLRDEIISSEDYSCLSTSQQVMVDHKLNPHNFQLLSAFAACWENGSTKNNSYDALIKKYPEVFNHSLDKIIGGDNFKYSFNDNSRWSSTATDGSGLSQGDPTTLTWSITPDGTSIHGYNGEPTSNSDLIAMLDNLYDQQSSGGADLTQRAWFQFFEDIFDRWSELTGFTYVYEPTDDGDPWSTVTFQGQLFASIASGEIGVRGDIRIGGHSIDGQLGSNTLAYNFFPNGGDMVIDTDNTNLFGNTFSNSLLLRNTLSHEHGHGLGLGHSCPMIQTKLMEPFISSQFDGPQFDDILGANRGYGDGSEPNDNIASATPLGTPIDGVQDTVEDMSIDDNSDTDYFSFNTTFEAEVDIELIPFGTSYLAGFQNSNGSCQSGTTFDPQTESNLNLELLNSSATVIASSSSNAVGQIESLTDQALTSGPGTYYIRVIGLANDAQMYQLTYRVDGTESCSDNIQNQGETGVDCGGPCAPCQGCTDSDAHNYNPIATVDDGSCETCSDMELNGDEVAVDCGGTNPNCSICITGCSADINAHNYIANPDIEESCLTCSDNILNGDEESVDCGGSKCVPCVTGCMEVFADNYDPLANVPGPCNYTCTESSGIIGSSSPDTVISSATTLTTMGTLNLIGPTPSYWRATSIEINANTTINSELVIDAGSCNN